MNCPVRNPKAEVVTEVKTEYCFIQNTLYRKDGRCGSNFKLSNGTAAQCDPESQFPCCSEFGYCGVTQEHCDCSNCIDHRKGKELLPKYTSFQTSYQTRNQWTYNKIFGIQAPYWMILNHIIC